MIEKIINKEWEDIECVLVNLDWASTVGMEHEFLSAFIGRVMAGDTIGDAVAFANREWDL